MPQRISPLRHLLLPLIFVATWPGVAWTQSTESHPASYHEDFKGLETLPDSWTVEGDAAVEDGGAFNDSRSLRLSRSAEKAHLPGSVRSGPFPAVPGEWEISLAGKSDLHSPDNSYNGKIWLECLNAEGVSFDRFPIADFAGLTEWKSARKTIELPAETTAARFYIVLNKTYGKFWVDALAATYLSAGREATQTVDRILFSSAQTGNLLFPEDPRTFTATVETFKALPEASRVLIAEVRDYWGTPQARALRIPLLPTGEKEGRMTYEGVIDLAAVPLEIGRYYEIHTSIPLETEGSFANHTSFAILPEAVTKKYPQEEIPFTARNWDNRIEEFYPLVDRIGIRICGIWGRWSPDPPYDAIALRIELAKKYGMAALSTTPINAIEHLRPGWEKFDENALRDGIRNLLEITKSVRPFYINLGNEPAGTPEMVKRDVAAYKTVYEEIKKTEPGIFVIGASAGPQEEFFRQGFGEWCDAYDFHTYSDTTVVREIIAEYQKLFAKYGHAKPIWSTELGLNSQGLERRAVATELVKKFTVFFAAGGANASWFGFIYPDRDLKLHGGSEDSHNVFDCRYARYAPRLDAVTYYHIVNAIAVKKFAEEKTYDDGTYAALFRDQDSASLQVLWREAGNKNIFLPLPGVDEVEVIRLDGRRSKLNAGGKGLTLTTGPDPLILLYRSPSAPLAAKLENPAATITSLPTGELVRGTTAEIKAKTDPGITIALNAPPLWSTKREAIDSSTTFSLTIPADDSSRAVDLLLPLHDEKDRACGELSLRLGVSGPLSVRVLPEPVSTNHPAGIRILLANKGTAPQTVSWSVEIVGSLKLEEGSFVEASEPGVHFAGPAEGTRILPSGQVEEITLPLEGVDPLRLYRVRVTAETTGEPPVVRERFIGGFAGVPRAKSPPILDGELNEAAWQTSPVQVLDQASQFTSANKKKKTETWSGPADLSARVRYLWDDDALYIGVETTDDIAGGLKADKAIWAQDGLQFLIDPARESATKPGKYDYAVALGAKGPQAWCYLTADSARAPAGEVKEIKVAAKRRDDKTGAISYEVAIPWSRIAPFQPTLGANLGLTLLLNEDDGAGRKSFMTWFGNAHTKEVETAGDLILMENAEK